MEQILSVLISVGIGAVLALVLFVGFNVLLEQAATRWPWFVAAVGAMVGLVFGAIMQHNGWFPAGLVGILLGGVLGLGVGFLLGVVSAKSLGRDATQIAEKFRPWVFIGPALLFVTVGLVGPAISTMIISFRGGKSGDEGVTLDNYRTIFTDKIAGTNQFFNVDNIGDVFTSRLFIAGLLFCGVAGILARASAMRFVGGSTARTGSLLSRLGIGALVAVVVAMIAGLIEGIVREPNESAIFDVLTVIVSSPVTLFIAAILAALTLVASFIGRRSDAFELDWGSPTASLLVVGAVILLLFSFLSTMQAVVWNNLWWVASVAGLSTVFGLLLAILADRTRNNRVEVTAKAMIFMPMAISMVGAAVIWDFMYEKQPSGDQTGLFNALLQAMGFETRGFFINASMIPWNNIWIMVIMIWIQTGFAMVILSAAIKGVPDELLEAARVDGATETQMFWRVVIPQIKSTIVVVVTTLVIIVMKVFDLVKATTGGANRTNVLANEMFDNLSGGRFALSSAFAVVIFALVLPIMVINVNRTRKELA